MNFLGNYYFQRDNEIRSIGLKLLKSCTIASAFESQSHRAFTALDGQKIENYENYVESRAKAKNS